VRVVCPTEVGAIYPGEWVVVVWFWVKNQEWGRDRLYVLLPFVFPRGLKSPCQWLCSGGWEVFVLVGVRGFWGAAKPQAVSRCARFFFWGGGW